MSNKVSYKIINRPSHFGGGKIIVRSDGLQFPESEANTDYQAYLAWVAEGNTAEEWQPDGE